MLFTIIAQKVYKNNMLSLLLHSV